MKKFVLLMLAMCAMSLGASAQRFALIDMEYILQNVPAYESANSEIEQLSKQWQAEVQKVSDEAKSLYESYQSAKNLTEAQRTQRENAIVEKEKSAAELRRKYFGQEGELAKKQQELMQPIMDDIYEVVKAIAQNKGYSMVIDRASASSIIFASPNIDISDDVLAELGE